MSGLFHLHPVSKFTKYQDSLIERVLYQAIRDCASSIRDRNIPLEDFYHEVVSLWEIRNDTFFVRFSQIDDAGKPFGSVSEVQTIVDVSLTILRAAANVYTPMDNPDQYERYYTAKEFEGAEFLYTPNNKWVRTVVVKYRD